MVSAEFVANVSYLISALELIPYLTAAAMHRYNIFLTFGHFLSLFYTYDSEDLMAGIKLFNTFTLGCYESRDQIFFYYIVYHFSNVFFNILV